MTASPLDFLVLANVCWLALFASRLIFYCAGSCTQGKPLCLMQTHIWIVFKTAPLFRVSWGWFWYSINDQPRFCSKAVHNTDRPQRIYKSRFWTPRSWYLWRLLGYRLFQRENKKPVCAYLISNAVSGLILDSSKIDFIATLSLSLKSALLQTVGWKCSWFCEKGTRF